MTWESRPVNYEIKDPLHINRWMCGKCGLIFDYQFEPDDFGGFGWTELDPPAGSGVEWEDANGVLHYDEPERREICPRCRVDFSESPLIPVAIDKFNLGSFLKTTFIVEDKAHENIVLEISKYLNKDKNVSIVRAGTSGNVKSFFKFAKSQGELDYVYFIVDGDNQNPGKEFIQEPHFFSLNKYCIENYLLDFEVCASISGKTKKDVKQILLGIIQDKSKNLGKSPLGEILIKRLTLRDMKPSLLSFLDAAEIIKDFVIDLGFKDQSKFLEKYVKYCHETSRLGRVFPADIVKAIKNSKIKSLPKE